jgi:enoyl-CoA hydratase
VIEVSVIEAPAGGAPGSGGVGLVELDRPERRNALDVAHCRMLADGVTALLARGVRAIVVTGAGSSFCAGADFGEVYSDGFRDALRAALRAVTGAPVPVVAAVNGPAIGGGTQLAIACDLRVAAPTAEFAVPAARLGVAVDPWTAHRLAQLAGGATARALLLACERIGPERALARGLVDRLGTREDALALAAELAALAPLTLRYSKLALDRTDLPVDDPLLTTAFEACWSSADLLEGRRAREERRPPAFTGE